MMERGAGGEGETHPSCPEIVADAFEEDILHMRVI